MYIVRTRSCVFECIERNYLPKTMRTGTNCVEIFKCPRDRHFIKARTNSSVCKRSMNFPFVNCFPLLVDYYLSFSKRRHRRLDGRILSFAVADGRRACIHHTYAFGMVIILMENGKFISSSSPPLHFRQNFFGFGIHFAPNEVDSLGDCFI